MAMGKKVTINEEPVDSAASVTVPERCSANMAMGKKLTIKEELVDFAARVTVPERCSGNLAMGKKVTIKEEPVDSAAGVTVPEGNDRPLRLYFGYGPRIHNQLAIEYGLVGKRCEECGEVGQVTCFSGSFRKWALRRVTEKELNLICSRCHERGHNCLSCDLPITYKFPIRGTGTRGTRGSGTRGTRVMHCSICGLAKHNCRTCPRRAK